MGMRWVPERALEIEESRIEVEILCDFLLQATLIVLVLLLELRKGFLEFFVLASERIALWSGLLHLRLQIFHRLIPIMHLTF